MQPFMISLRRAGDLSHFILPEHSGKGIGKMILEFFIREAGRLGVDTFVAGISSLNEGSLRFHEKIGFSWCGLFTKVRRKRWIRSGSARLFDQMFRWSGDWKSM